MVKLLICCFLLSTSVFVFADDCDLQFTKKSLCAKVEFKKVPNRKYSSDFTLSFFDLQKKKPKPLNGKLHVFLRMKMKSGHEHGSEIVKMKKITESKYLITNVWFMMLGDWQLHVQIEEDGKIVDKAQKLVQVVRGVEKK